MPVQPQRAALVAAVLATLSCAEPTDHVRTWQSGPTPVRLEVRMAPPGDIGRLESEAVDAVTRTRGLLAAEAAEGALAALNREAGGEFVEIEDRDLYRALLLALDWARASRGAYDPTLAPVTRLWREAGGRPPGAELAAALEAVDWSRVVVAEEARAVRLRDPGMAFDLGPLVDGFAADAAARAFSLPGTRRGVIRVGGAGYAWSGVRGGEPAAVSIRDHARPERVLLTLALHNRAFGASMPCAPSCVDVPPLDPATGLPPARGVRMAIAIADSAADAAVIARALHASSPQRAGDLLARSRRVEAVLLVDDPDEGPVLLLSASLTDRVQIAPALDAEVAGRVRPLLPPERFPPP